MRKRLWLFLLIIPLLFGGACQENPVENSSQTLEVAGEGTTLENPHHEEADPTQISLPPEALRGQIFQTALVTRQTVLPEIKVTSTIRPNQYKLAQISPRIGGKAIQVFPELGDLVQEGQTLAILDSIELGQKKAEFLQARTNLKIARRNFEREQRLFKQRISSEKEFLDAKGEFERSVAAYRATHEALRMIGLPEEGIKDMHWEGKDYPLSYFHLTAPFAGTIVARKITIGEMIGPTDVPFTLADLSTVWVSLDIFEKDLAHISEGLNVRIRVDAFPNEWFEGILTHLSNLLDPDTRTLHAHVEVDNQDGRLRPGMFAIAAIRLPSSDQQDSLVAPQTAIQKVANKSVAFVEERAGTYAVREVILGTTVPPNIEIRKGLKERERVVTEGSFYLKSILLAETIGADSD
ncbi:MAG: RND transporter [Nitrospirales bacterium]|nr:MAG: RND transporter [Nitrospirales bacterium]